MANLLSTIESHLNAANPREQLTPLFCETLMWGRSDLRQFSHRIRLGQDHYADVAFTPIAQLSGLQVFRVDWPADKPPTITQRRAVHRALAPSYVEHLLVYVTADNRQLTFVWARRRDKKKVEMRALPYAVGAPARTTIERLGELAFTLQELGLFGDPGLPAVADRLNAAFDVEAVTQAFFDDYQSVFEVLRKHLDDATGDLHWAHDYALQVLNRLLFLYFVQRKRWLGDDPAFVANFWKAYKSGGRPPDTFFDEWLNVLFFEAFNDQFQAGRADYLQRFPDAIRTALAMAPYLNGGLFTRNELDREHDVTIPDSIFEMLFDRFEGRTPGFLERYNFTITESTPFDIEVAVDPEMIGKVYESLVNVSEEADERGEAGIFYTPRVEIDLMCRLSLVDWLSNHLGEERKPVLYEAVFAYEEEDKDQADRQLTQQNLWPKLDDLLRDVTVVDPACGSGSFLVGMLLVLDDLTARANAQLGTYEDVYDRRKRIIGSSLYGVDVMEWAVHVAELRLWLQLVIETELSTPKLKLQPLLPNLTFNIRPGDSLVQEVGGLNLALRKGSGLIPPAIKGRITQLKGEKLKFYRNDPQRRYQSARQLRQAELDLFREILTARADAIDKRLIEIAEALRPQVNLFGEEQTTQLGLDRTALEREQDRLKSEREQVVRASRALQTAQSVPFVWDIAFVEVFEGDKGGFDIVIGNPPYVRQEAIRDPRSPAENVTTASKKAYKAKLARAVYTVWPRTFGYDWAQGASAWSLDAKSDLYIYFYFHGLSLLNAKGAFCFITSNSWLDVGYGSDLQDFLLTRGQVKFVIDNQVRRSFASADVNTVIVLLGPPRDTASARRQSLDHTARFVMVTVPFEDVLSPIVWEEVEEAKVRTTKPEYRVFPLTQAELRSNGMDPEKKRFTGDKWGGKYLRAPDIYWTILEKAGDKLVRLGDIANVRRGFTTGANDFFYLDDEAIAQWGIEERFLKPVIKSPRECKRIRIDAKHLTYHVFLCHEDERRLKGTAALNYIRWGEIQGFHKRASFSSRVKWWDLGVRELPKVFTAKGPWDRHFFCYSNGGMAHDQQIYGVYGTSEPMSLCASLNATYTGLFLETLGRSNFGEGILWLATYELSDLPVLPPSRLPSEATSALVAMADRDVGNVFTEVIQPDRHVLDDIIFDVLGLTQGERDAVYEAVIDLVEARLGKAQSLS